MDKKKIELVITIVLIVIFILAVANALKKAKPAQVPTQQPTVAQTIKQEDVRPLFKVKKGKAKAESRELGWGRDPFVLQDMASGLEKTADNLKLMGITVGNNNRPVAIIDDEMVSVGASIGKFKVMKIKPDKVIVNDGEKDYELKMAE